MALIDDEAKRQVPVGEPLRGRADSERIDYLEWVETFIGANPGNVAAGQIVLDDPCQAGAGGRNGTEGLDEVVSLC